MKFEEDIAGFAERQGFIADDIAFKSEEIYF